jgi:hypothetical protein
VQRQKSGARNRGDSNPRRTCRSSDIVPAVTVRFSMHQLAAADSSASTAAWLTGGGSPSPPSSLPSGRPLRLAMPLPPASSASALPPLLLAPPSSAAAAGWSSAAPSASSSAAASSPAGPWPSADSASSRLICASTMI